MRRLSRTDLVYPANYHEMMADGDRHLLPLWSIVLKPVLTTVGPTGYGFSIWLLLVSAGTNYVDLCRRSAD
jgi:hypothetical protein